MSPETAKSQETKTKLLEGALRTLTEHGIAKTSARTVAAAAGVNQALVFYHFGSVDELLAAACRYGAEQAVSRYRARLAAVTSLSELLALGRAIHEEERAGGHVALLGQLLAGAQTHPALGPATAGGLQRDRPPTGRRGHPADDRRGQRNGPLRARRPPRPGDPPRR
ncbi:hypothetical protein SGLAM104S_02171 [Streptomyces glaucescens]